MDVSLGLSDRTQSKISPSSDTEQQKSPRPHDNITAAASSKPRSRATSFVSARSAQQRDLAAKKWFTDIQELDIAIVGQFNGPNSLPRKERTESEFLEQHEIRPRTDLNALFAPCTTRSASLARLQNKRELGGDYTRYLPGGYADPRRLPIDYARLVLGRNKYITLDAQVGALNVLEEAIRERKTKQGM